MAKASASAQLFCLLTGLGLLAGAALGGYVAWINHAEISLYDQPPTVVNAGAIADVRPPAFVRLEGVVAGTPVLVANSKNKQEDAKTLPPTMNVWVPLFATPADRDANKVAAIYLVQGAPLAEKATLPRQWEGLIAVGAFGMLKQKPPAPLPGDALVLSPLHPNSGIVYQLPGIIAGVVGVLGLISLAVIPWANWEMPKAPRASPRPAATPVRVLPAALEPLAVYGQRAGGFWAASAYFMVPGVLLLVIGGIIVGGAWAAGNPGESAFIIFLMIGVGLGLVVMGAIKGNRRSEEVAIYEDGIAWRDGRVRRSAHWDDVREVYRTETKTTYQYAFTTREAETRLVFCDHTELRFDQSVTDYDELCAEVFAHAIPGINDRKREELRAGEADFGQLALTTEGVRHTSGKVQPWGDLVGYTVENGQFWLRTGGINLLASTYQANELPNLPVLVELLDECFAEDR